MTRPLLACCAVLAALVLAACGGGGKTVTVGGAPTTTTSETAAGCTKVSSPASHATTDLGRPKMWLNPARTHVVTLRTNCGSIRIALDVKAAPKTTNSFATLVREHFYDHLIFFRIAKNFVIQGGDPLQNGTGGPGYETVEAPPSNLRYTRGVVAMAKGQDEAAGTAGSQFFIVTIKGRGAAADYALVGHVIGSFAAVDKIARTPADSDQRAMQTILIERATLRTT